MFPQKSVSEVITMSNGEINEIKQNLKSWANNSRNKFMSTHSRFDKIALNVI